MKAAIAGIAYELPARVVTNEDLAQLHPAWGMDRVVTRTGVEERHIADNETALDLAERAVDALVYDHPDAARADAILFCTQTPDQTMPPNSALLHDRLGLGDDVFALDFNHACSGFVYGLELARGLIATGRTRILLVTADTYSRVIDPDDRGPVTIFGDGAAATLITPGDRGVVDLIAQTSGRHGGAFVIPPGGSTVVMNGAQVLSFIRSHVPGQVRELLDRNGLVIDDVDLFVFHQASALALETLTSTLRLPSAKVYSNLARVGNLVSASIPVALQDAIAEGRVGGGSRVVLSGFGVGMSWASAIVEL